MKQKGIVKSAVLILAVLVVALALLIPGQTPSARAAGVIKVGIPCCFVGPPGKFGKEAVNAFEMAAKEINKAGGVLGRKIEFTTRDTKFKADIAITMAKELVMREKVDIIVGTISSASALAVSDYCKAEKVPFIVWMAQSERITGELGHRYVFGIVPNTRMWARAMAHFEAKQPYTKYWIARPDFEFGRFMAENYWSVLKALKPEVELLGESRYKPGEPDLAPYLTAIMAAKPEALISCASGADITNFLKAVKTTGLSGQMAISQPILGHSMIAPLGPNAPENVLGCLHYFPYYPDTPANKAFVKKYKDAYGTLPGFPAFGGYTSAYFIAEALKKAGSMDTEKFIDALEGLKIDSPIGTVEMRAYDHQIMLPIYVGVTKKVPEHKFLIMTDFVKIPARDAMPPIEEIKKLRGKK